jgi:hypothetical protein
MTTSFIVVSSKASFRVTCGVAQFISEALEFIGTRAKKDPRQKRSRRAQDAAQGHSFGKLVQSTPWTLVCREKRLRMPMDKEN